MCGRYTLYTPEQEAEIRAIIKEVERKMRSSGVPFNANAKDIYPTDIAPVLVGSGKNRLEAKAMVWGYPKFKGSGVLFNTRSESALEKAMWSDSTRHRRCIIPSTGFYEWQHKNVEYSVQTSFLPTDEGKKSKKEKINTKYLFTMPGVPILYMAAIYKEYREENGLLVGHFSIMTTTANPSVSDIHDRMPLVLKKDELDIWLGENYTSLFNRSDISLNREQAL